MKLIINSTVMYKKDGEVVTVLPFDSGHEFPSAVATDLLKRNKAVDPDAGEGASSAASSAEKSAPKKGTVAAMKLELTDKNIAFASNASSATLNKLLKESEDTDTSTADGGNDSGKPGEAHTEQEVKAVAEAIAALDTANPELWNEDGSPKLEAVNKLLDADITDEQLSEAAAVGV